MNAIEPFAEAVTAAAVARAVEPATGLDRTGHTTERACLNCGTALAGAFCHACGQKGHVHRTLRSLGHDLAHGVLHFEGKIWRTLPMLAWRPGELTRRYINGERARFVSPLALFLFSAFLLAAVLSALPGGSFMEGLVEGLSDNKTSLTRADERLASKSADLARQRSALASAGQPTERLDREIAEVAEEREGLAKLMAPNRPKVGVKTDTNNEVNAWLDSRWKAAKANPQLLIYKIKTSAYKFSWVLLPMSIPALWLLFPFSRRFRTYDHAIFVIYSLSFMSLLAVLLATLALVPALTGVMGVLLLVLPPVHFYRQLRGAYQLRRRSALWRALALTILAGIIFGLWVTGLMVLGAL